MYFDLLSKTRESRGKKLNGKVSPFFGVALKSEWRRFGRIDVLFNVVFVSEFVGICCVIVH